MSRNQPMLHAGIIAAGAGSRMARRHPGLPKPLIPVGGRPLVAWVVRALERAGARELTVLVNSRGGAVEAFLRGEFPRLRWRFLRRDTASSWESFRLVAKDLARRADRFLISTADALVPPAQARRFAAAAFAAFPGQDAPAAALALTRFVEDEKPLWAQLGPGGRVARLGDEVRRRDGVTCGLYALTRREALALPPARSHARLRDFWSGLVAAAEVRGVLLADTVDVDRPADLPAAERIVRCFAA